MSDVATLPPQHELSSMKDLIAATVAQMNKVLLGKEHQIKLALGCLFGQGHLLIEDIPGMGKTTLSHVLAKVLGLEYKRIQFTSDLLPADILGVSVYEKNKDQFTFHPGPIFSQVVLADEINRATPKAQSALLEAMEERQVSIDGETRELPAPFFVIATQNPLSQSGTFPLPESQMDRFFMRISLGYPDAKAERELLLGRDRRELIEQLTPSMSYRDLQRLQQGVRAVAVSDAVLDYLQRLISHTREQGKFGDGLSPRGGIALLRASQSWALMHGRQHVMPDDVQAVLPSVVEHRVSGGHTHTDNPLSKRLLHEVDVIS